MKHKKTDYIIKINQKSLKCLCKKYLLIIVIIKN